jgi:hypothetical protein
VVYPVRGVSAGGPALSVPGGRAAVVRHHNLFELVDRRFPRHDDSTAAGQLDSTRCTRTRSARSRSCSVAVGSVPDKTSVCAQRSGRCEDERVSRISHESPKVKGRAAKAKKPRLKIKPGGTPIAPCLALCRPEPNPKPPHRVN